MKTKENLKIFRCSRILLQVFSCIVFSLKLSAQLNISKGTVMYNSQDQSASVKATVNSLTEVSESKTSLHVLNGAIIIDNNHPFYAQSKNLVSIKAKPNKNKTVAEATKNHPAYLKETNNSFFNYLRGHTNNTDYYIGFSNAFATAGFANTYKIPKDVSLHDIEFLIAIILCLAAALSNYRRYEKKYLFLASYHSRPPPLKKRFYTTIKIFL